jgi:hypothetical protein
MPEIDIWRAALLALVPRSLRRPATPADIKKSISS